MGAKFKADDVVQFKGRGGRTVLAVVVKSRLVRARKRPWFYRYTLAPLNDSKEGRWWEAEEAILRPAPEKAATVSGERREAVVNEQRQNERNRNLNRLGRAEDGRCTLRDLGIKEGVRVLIRGRNCPNWEATVAQVNYRTGKFAINRSAEAVQEAKARAAVMQMMGRQGTVRRFRWVSPDCVVKVLNGNG